MRPFRPGLALLLLLNPACEDTGPFGFVPSASDTGTDAEAGADAGLWCVPSNGGVEICNGIDDDCNQLADDVSPDAEQLKHDPNHCGQCGNRCEAPNAQAWCKEGVCGFVCHPGWNNMDGAPENGCEIQCVVTDGGVEVLDGIDNDCDGETDEDFDL